MKLNNYIFANSGLQVNFMKVSENINQTIAEAMINRNSTTKTIFWNDFKEKDGGLGSTIWGCYYQQIRGRMGTFSVYRKTPNQKFYEHVCELTEDYEFIDYNIVDNGFYHYLVAFKTDEVDFYTVYQNILPNGTEDYINTPWDSWSITDIIETADEKVYGQIGDVWRIKYNLSAGKLTTNTSVTTWNTLGQFPKFSIGVEKFHSGEVTCLIGDILPHTVLKLVPGPDGTSSEYLKEECTYTEKINLSNKYAQETEKYKAWDMFINDGELKLLKDNKGNSWIVQVQASPTASIDYNSNLQQTEVSFSWQEAVDVEGVAIITNSIVANIEPTT